MGERAESHDGAGPPSSRDDVLPIFDISPYLSRRGGDHGEALCRGVAESLKRSGALVVVDPRVDSRANSRFIDVMEAYFGQPSDVKLRDARPHLHYQVGVTPEGIERPRCLNDQSILDLIDQLGQATMPLPRGGHTAPIQSGATSGDWETDRRKRGFRS